MKNKPALTELNRRIAKKQEVLKQLDGAIGEKGQELIDYEATVEKRIIGSLVGNESAKFIYSYPDNVPDYAKNLPEGAQKICVSAFNSTFERTQDEDKARIACWGAVKNAYEQNAEGEWVRKTKEMTMLDLEELDTVQKAYAAHNRLHAEYLDARHTRRKKTEMQEEHEALVKHILDLGGRHLAKGDALDDTLPQDMKETVKLRYLSDSLELEEGAELNRIQILRTGTFHHPQYGKFVITDETLETMVKNFQEVRPKSPTELVVDFEHLSAGDLTDPKQGKAAGWIKSLVKQDGGLFADVQWNEEAAEAIKKKEFRFISPEFDLNYTDKESGKKVGPTLISAALTNRPFLEGMAPVVLSRDLGAMIFAEEESIDELTRAIRDAYYVQFPGVEIPASRGYISDIYVDFVIIESGGEMFKLPYTRDEETGKVTFDTANQVKVTLAKIYEPIALTEEFKEWDTKYINNLPNGAFAYIKPDGEKDEEGKTVPRSLRYLPFKNAQGEVDLPHLHNALSRLPQTTLSPEEKVKARAVLQAAAEKAGVGEVGENQKGKEKQVEKEIRKLLELGEDADVLEVVRTLKAKSEETETLQAQVKKLEGEKKALEEKVTGKETKLQEIERDKIVDEALAKGKITPKMKEWAAAYALNDPEGFKNFVESAEKVGPDLHIKGKDGEPGEGDAIQLTDTERKIAKKLGLSEEIVLESKKTEAEKETK